MRTIRPAVPADTATVWAVLHGVASWLHSRGCDQWPHDSPSLTMERLGAQIKRGETYLVYEDDDPIATVAVTGEGDREFWTERELARPSWYGSKAAVVRRCAGEGIGELLWRWVGDRAAQAGAELVRVDVWLTNSDLHDYYARTGWAHVRTVALPGRRSGVLFERAAVIDEKAEAAFEWREPPADRRPVPIGPGSRVLVDQADGPISATVSEIWRDVGMSEVSQGWENSVGGPPIHYRVTRGERTWIAPAAIVWPAP